MRAFALPAPCVSVGLLAATAWRLSRPSTLFQNPRAPIRIHRERSSGRRAFHRYRDQEALAVAGNLEARIGGDIKQRLRFAGLHRRFGQADGRGHDFPALAKEQFLAVAPPHGPIAAFGRDLPAAFSRGNRFDQNLILAGLVGFVRHPLIVGRYGGPGFIETGLEVRIRFAIAVGLHNPNFQPSTIVFWNSGRLPEEVLLAVQ